MPGEATHATAEAVARRSYGKLVAFLAARSGDVAGAEDALADAFAAALADWDTGGIPDNPEGWLLTVGGGGGGGEGGGGGGGGGEGGGISCSS
jgi:predicted RNA polymerase sigma factor